MTTIYPPGPGSTALDGMPTDLRAPTALGPIRNGQPATARPIRRLERAAQHLASSRKLSLMSTRLLVAVGTTSAPQTYPVGLLPLEPYTQYADLWVLYSTGNGETRIILDVITAQTSPSYYPASPAELQSTETNTLDDALWHAIEGVEVGLGTVADQDTECYLNLRIDAAQDAGAAASTVTVYDVVVIPRPMTSIVI